MNKGPEIDLQIIDDLMKQMKCFGSMKVTEQYSSGHLTSTCVKFVALSSRSTSTDFSIKITV